MREEWTKCKLKDICTDISYGYTASANDKPVGPKFLRITDIVRDKVNWESVPFCVIDDKSKERYKLVIGDIVIARTGATTGSVTTIRDTIESVFASYLIRYRIDEKKATPFFIDFLLRSDYWDKHVQNIVGGSAQPGANAQEFASFEFFLPSLETQQKIARILSTLDGVIARTEGVIAKYTALKAGLLQDLFTRGIGENGQLRPSPHEAPDLYKESALGLIPKECEVENIGKYAFVTKLAGFEYTMHFDYAKGGEIIAIRALNIKNGFLNLEHIHTIPKATSDFLIRSKLSKGDLVISYVGTVGQVAEIEEDNKFHLAPNVAKITVNQLFISPNYLNHFLNSDFGQSEIAKQTASTTQAALSMRNLREILFLLPEHSEQIAIANHLNELNLSIQTEQTYLAKLQGIRAGLMADLLSGTVDVSTLAIPTSAAVIQQEPILTTA